MTAAGKKLVEVLEWTASPVVCRQLFSILVLVSGLPSCVRMNRPVRFLFPSLSLSSSLIVSLKRAATVQLTASLCIPNKKEQ